MIPSKIHALLKGLKCPHYQDPRRSQYFPDLCETCARTARFHLDSILQDWIYCDNGNCGQAPGQHNAIMAANPTQFLQQMQNEYYGEFFVQIKNDRVYVIAKISTNPGDYINDVKIGAGRNNNRVKEIYFRHTNNVSSSTRMDNVDLIRRNYNNASALIIGEMYFKFDISEVNVHLDIINDSHIRIIPKKNKNDRFTFVYLQ